MPARSRQPRGFILLLGLLIVVSVTAISAVLTRTVYQGIFVGRQLNASIPAYFAAETGIERTLHFIRRHRALNSSFADTIGSINTGLPFSFSSPALSVPGVTYAVTASQTEQLQFGLDEGESATVDLFDPDDFSVGAGVDAIEIELEDGTPLTTTIPWLEVSLVEFSPGAGLGLGPDAASTFIATDQTDVTTTVSTRLAADTCVAGGCCLTQLTPGNSYRLRVKALFDDAQNVRIRPYDGNNCSVAPADNLVSLKSRVVLKSTGTVLSGPERVEQAITASMNWLTPASPLFDYTLFSEEPLDKR